MSVDIQEGYNKAFDNVLRLRIMSILMVNDRYDFNFAREATRYVHAGNMKAQSQGKKLVGNV